MRRTSCPRHCLKALGEKTVIVNAAGCFSLLSIYPFTPFKGSWLHTAWHLRQQAHKVRDALDILIKKGRIKPDEDLKVVVLTGDGAAYDMGLSSHQALYTATLIFIISAMIMRLMAIQVFKGQAQRLMHLKLQQHQ